ncbi:ssk1 response regulator receiver [Orbilia ellipsospora]|uniref:Ssk1 response regulator receiver n=1 Tax=Orbilia ellipsospora TaxID=2528407 RepID=A0AAV9XKM7_9PEZI
MLLWKAAANKLRAVNGMRGFRDKIKGTKTKLLRRDSGGSTEEAAAVRPSKAAKAASTTPTTAVGNSNNNGITVGSSEGSWGRRSKRQSLLGRNSRSDHSLVSSTVETTTEDPETPPTFATEAATAAAAAAAVESSGLTTISNGEVVVVIDEDEKKRRSGDIKLQPQPKPPDTITNASHDPMSVSSSSGLNSKAEPNCESITYKTSNVSIVPIVLVSSKVGAVEEAPSNPQPPAAAAPENTPATTPSTRPTEAPPTSTQIPTSTSTSTSTSSPPSAPLSDRSSESDATIVPRRSNSKRAGSQDLSINTTNLPPVFSRPYRLSQFPTDPTGLSDTSLSQLRRTNSRKSPYHGEGVHPLAHDTHEVPDNESKRDSTITNLSHGSEPPPFGAHSYQPLDPAVPIPVAAVTAASSSEAPQPLDTVSETGIFQTNDLHRNESVKSIAKTPLLSTSGSRRKQVFSFSRRQSLIHSSDSTLLRSLLEQESASPTFGKDSNSNIQLVAVPMPQNEQLRTRRVWVKRPGGSPTQVIVAEDDFVDTVRDLCLRKYANALGRQYDSPDLMIRICPPAKPQSARARQTGPIQPNADRLLLPDEILCQLLDDYFPNGQSSEDALVVEVPQPQRSRTPRPSPGPHSMSYAYGQTVHDLQLPGEDYFTPVGIVPSMPHSQPGTVRSAHNLPANPSSLSNYMASSPPPPSPGHRSLKRPGPVRMATGSPVGSVTSSGPGGQGVMLIPRAGGGGADRIRATSADVPTSPPVQPQMVALPSSPGVVKPIPPKPASPGATVTSPAAITKPPTKKETISASIGTLDGQVPSINVLIVEDNIINLRLLEAFMKRLKVRWATAMNGRDAVTKWRTGGFQLVLMDIQLPIMNGLDATKEIRRLERLNGIGSFSSSLENEEEPLSSADKLDKALVFKGSVIIVALTASSLRSDRDEALAVGCNDFLTKPVNFTFLERKVMEWGCMQALIDFEGWRKWKDLANKPSATGGKTAKGNRAKTTSAPIVVPISSKDKESTTQAQDSASSSSSTPQPPPQSAGQS